MTNLSSLDYVENFSISKSINDATWKLSATFDKDDAPEAMMGIRAFGTDHADVEHCLFLGFVPGSEFVYKMPNNKVSLTAFDYSWYLAAQHVPLEYIETTIPDDIEDYDLVKKLLEGSGVQFGGYDVGYSRPGLFNWNIDTAKSDAINELCEYGSKYFFVVFKDVGGGAYQTTAYYSFFVDDYVPAMITFTNPSDHVITYSVTEKSLEKYNRVRVYGTDPETGDWYTKTYETAAVTAGEEKPIEYIYQSAKLTSQAKVDARALSYYANLYEASPTLYSATLHKRYDLRLMQKVVFSGFDNIPAIQMRITGINYQRALNQDFVTIDFVQNQSLSLYRNLNRVVSDDIVSIQEQAIDRKLTGLANLEIGEVVEVTDNLATVVLERSSNTITARILD